MVAGPSLGSTLKREVPARADVMNMQTAAPTGLIVVKFTSDSGLEMTEAGLTGGDQATRGRVLGMVADKSRNGTLERRFQRPSAEITADRLRAEARGHRSLANLNSYAVIDPGVGEDRAELLRILKSILADPAVETAFLEPKAVPAALGFDAFTGKWDNGQYLVDMARSNIDLVTQNLLTTDADKAITPDFSGDQGYLGAAPVGVNALAADGIPGARGSDMLVIDVEGAWLWDHEDLVQPTFTYGGPNTDIDWRNHGTAVLGEIRGSDNGFGVRGIAPDVSIGGAAAYIFSVAQCIDAAAAWASEGDIIVIELHAPGPNSDGDGQFGYMPMEYWQDNFDAMQLAAANGRLVCEAAGNGYQNLDDPIYGTLFDRTYRDSGALMCGAANEDGFVYSYSNYGSRVDLNGWGGNVTTCAYGDLQGDPEPEIQWYTSQFSGTSSATPIVTGAVVAVQGMIKADFAFALDAFLMRDLLAQTGSPQQASSHNIGPRPDIMAAWTQIQTGFGNIEGTLIDDVSALPIPDATITVQTTGQLIMTDATGQFSFSTYAGPQTLDLYSFFHEDASVVVDVPAGDTSVVEVSMTPIPTVTIVGKVTDQSGIGLADARVTPVNVLLTADLSLGDGIFRIPGSPVGRNFDIMFDGAPGFGADLVNVTPVWNDIAIFPLHSQLPSVVENFDYWYGGYTVLTGTWSWGIPVAGPESGFSDPKCWGIGMDGLGYLDNSIEFMTSAPYTYLGESQVLLSFHYWCDLESGFDGVRLEIRNLVGTYELLEPLGGYPEDRVASLDYGPGWSGNSDGWRGAVFDVQPYSLGYIIFQLRFSSDESGSGGGFYFDEVCFDTGDGITPVEFIPQVAGVSHPVVKALPNPFNPQTNIAWEIPQAGELGIRVFDTRGRLVRNLHSGPVTETSGMVVWDGKDSRGASLASGTYLVQVRDGQGLVTTARVSLVK